MYYTFLGLLAFFPIALILGMVYIGGQSSRTVVHLGCLVGAVIAWAVWKVDLTQILASTVKGLLMAFETVFFILAMSIVMGRAMRETHAAAIIREEFARLNADRRVQAIVLAWLWGAGMESILGFGGCTGVASTMLAGIGFPPAGAVMMAVLGSAVSSAFSVMGTPVVYGIKGGIEDPTLLANLAAHGMNLKQYLHTITAQAGVIHAIVGTFQPLIMIMALTRFFGNKRTWTEGLSIAPFAIFAGLSFTIPYALTAVYLGPEFPSLIGSIVGLSIVITALRFNFLIPHDRFEFPPRSEWRNDWSAGHHKPHPPVIMPPWRAWLPFVLLAGGMVFTRLPLTADFLKSLFSIHTYLWGTPVLLDFYPLFLPTVIFILLIIYLSFDYGFSKYLQASTTQLFIPIASIIRKAPFPIALACIYANSSVNHSGLPGMPQVMTDLLVKIPGSHFWSFLFSPFLAGIGVFSPESPMFSNLEYSMLQYHLGQSLGLSGTLFVALQIVGSSAGTMIAFNYIAGAGVYLGMLGWESPTFRRTLIPWIVYTTLVGIIGYIASHVSFFSDPLQMGF